MAKKKFGIEFEGFDELVEDLRALGENVKPIAEEALKATHAYITPKLHDRMKKNYMPAKGKYMGNRSEVKEDRQIIDDINIEWEGDLGKIDVGFSLDEGISPLFLIYGTGGKTPTNPAIGLKNALYGKTTKDEVAKIQEDIFYEALMRAMNNGK